MTADANTDSSPESPSSPDSPPNDAATIGRQRDAAPEGPRADAPTDDVVEARLEDALERVAHGATVSVPGILAERGLSVAFTARS